VLAIYWYLLHESSTAAWDTGRFHIQIIFGMSKFGGQASFSHNFTTVIPGTEYVQVCLFVISGNDPKFIYDLLKFIDFNANPIDIDGKAAIFTNISDENDGS